MGRASRWLRSLLGAGKKDAAGGGGCEVREKRRWSFAKLPRQVPPAEIAPSATCSDGGGHESPASALELAWLRSFYEDGEEGSKRALAVAVATAAAANAAVTAAQAAMVRLKSISGERTAARGSYERWSAAVKIQTAFRCYLAKKALRALKGLVKLQALVRGFLVRKQAAMTLRRLQALVRAQSAARSRESSLRRSFEMFNDRSTKNLETDSFRSKSKSFRRTSSSNLNALEELVSSPVLHKVPPRLSIPSCRSADDHRTSPGFRTAPNTPRLGLATPARSFFPTSPSSPSSCPNYMLSTTSFVAKARVESAPKQRPEKPRSPRTKAEVGGGKSPLRGWEGYDVKRGMERKLDRSPMAVRGEAAMDYSSLSGNW